ncbi:MAG TPA: archaeal proteasome endopeptidase complex subunit alpha, partial [Alphaproteobacteria bacterium]|nr:archaeal proteasome endopeptidase complex subunit alpha [Alphaproteobacteria bacterium]
VLLVTDKRLVDKLIVSESLEKIWQVDDHIAMTGAGILSDARILVDRARVKAQEHRVVYDSAIDVITIVKDIADLKQMCTQSGGLRPFGVSLLIAGSDEDTVKLFETDPTGIYFQYKATAIGEGDSEVKAILGKEYKDNLSVDDGLKLALSALKRVVSEGFDPDRIDCVYITNEKKTYEKMPRDKIAKTLASLDGKKK